MPWVRFTGPFDWSPPERGGRVTIAYETGGTYLVPTKCARAALAAGRAVKCKKRESDGDTESAGRG